MIRKVFTVVGAVVVVMAGVLGIAKVLDRRSEV